MPSLVGTSALPGLLAGPAALSLLGDDPITAAAVSEPGGIWRDVAGGLWVPRVDRMGDVNGVVWPTGIST